MQNQHYQLPPLPYAYNALAPYLSEEQLRLHHDKHHLVYVNSANAILDKLAKARMDKSDLDLKATLKELSFHVGGHVLHTLLWRHLAPAGQNGGGEPSGKLAEKIKEEFGDFLRFKKEFAQTAVSVEGSGWGALVYGRETGRLMLMQIEKHNLNLLAGADFLMALDVWEHAYYLDYKNERAKYIEAFWQIVNWGEVEKNLEKALKS